MYIKNSVSRFLFSSVEFFKGNKIQIKAVVDEVDQMYLKEIVGDRIDFT